MANNYTATGWIQLNGRRITNPWPAGSYTYSVHLWYAYLFRSATQTSSTDVTLSLNHAAAGVVVTSSAAGVSASFAHAGSGSLSTSGSAVISGVLDIPTGGSASCSGAAGVTVTAQVFPAGSLVASGAASTSFSVAVVSSGSVTLSGTASGTSSTEFFGQGGVALSGTGAVSVIYDYETVSGGRLVLSGTAGVVVEHTVSPPETFEFAAGGGIYTGGYAVPGRVRAVFARCFRWKIGKTIDIAKRFDWGTETCVQRFYRIEGRCQKKACVGSNPGCDVWQSMVANVYACSPDDACRAFKSRYGATKIKTVKMFVTSGSCTRLVDVTPLPPGTYQPPAVTSQFSFVGDS